MSIFDSLPADLVTAHATIIAQRQALSVAEARATAAESEAQYRALLIEKLKYTIAKLRHQQFGQSSERERTVPGSNSASPQLEAKRLCADAAEIVSG